MSFNEPRSGDGAPRGRPAEDAPVLIAGAGPVGLTAALALARFGVPSQVLEAAPEEEAAVFRRTGSKAICFQRDVLDVFDRLGVGERIIAEGTTWTTARTYYRGQEVRTVVFPGGTGRGGGLLPPWINISQARVEEELLAAAEAEPNIRIRFGHRVTGLRQDEAGVLLRADAPGGPAGLRGRYAVGADGPHSAVRRLLGTDFPGESFGDRFLICDIRADLPFPRERRFYFDPVWNPGRQVLVHQCPDSAWRIDWQVPDGYDLEAERESGALDRRIRAITGDRRYELLWTSVYRFHERCAARLRAGRVLLAGDAAHLYAPFGARGLNSGVQDAENLAWKIACALGSGAAAEEALLESYHTERWAAARENLRVTAATMRFLVPRTDADRRRRAEVLERSLTDPAAGSEIDSGRLAEPFRYADSPLTTPGGAVPAQARPGAPGPGDICPDALCAVPASVGGGGRDRTRLRRLLGPGFTVLAPGAAQARAVCRGRAGLPLPLTVHALDELDPDGRLAEALGRPPGTLFVLRPDAHLCAVLSPPGGVPRQAGPEAAAEEAASAVRAALARACGARPRVRSG
ncbi:FAD-dependent monooxygenase [Nocardiopsis sp. CNT-189]|uniref:FAD-dependent monooxygenase n=1 Tax=Nocardiopsis oceanisediminis TaxID=2816862 RepID=UPI003B33D943